MARTTTTKVENVLGNNYDITIDLNPFVEAANAVVSEVNTCAIDRGRTLTSTVLELIERWLAAHFYAAADQLPSREKTERAEANYQGQWAMGMDSTTYGQRAKLLDPTGCLASLGDSVQPQMVWLGKPPSDQVDYVDRD